MIKDIFRVIGALFLFAVVTATALTCAELPKIASGESTGRFEPTPEFTIFTVVAVLSIAVIVIFRKRD